MSLTKLENLIDPEVLADFVETELPAKIRFKGLLNIDDTLEGRAGSTITVPVYNYIGDAEIIPEGTDISTVELTTDTEEYKVAKYGKGTWLSDEAILSAIGDPIGQVGRQFADSIGQAIDTSFVTVAIENANSLMVVDKSTVKIKEEDVEAVRELFNEEDIEPALLVIDPSQRKDIVKSANFIKVKDMDGEKLHAGVIGEWGTFQVLVSKRTPEAAGVFSNLIVKKGALTLFRKRGLEVETSRVADNQTTKFFANKHCVVSLTDKTKVAVIKTKK